MELEQSAAVFSGELVSIDGESPVILTFKVSRVWKGAVAETLVLTTSSLGEGDCGYPFEAERAYLVYADAGHDLLEVYLCSGTQPLEYAQRHLDILGEGQIPVRAAGAPDGLAIGLIAGVTIALAGLALVAFRRRARQG